jgi:hypothetical protein
LEWDTLFPTITALPVISQTLDIALNFLTVFQKGVQRSDFFLNYQRK